MAETQITSIDDVKRDMFVKLVDRDKSGKFSYTGQVVDINLGVEQKVGMEKKKVKVGAGFTMNALVEIGEKTHLVQIGIDMEDPTANEIYATTTKPKGWASFLKDPEKFRKEEEKKKAVPIATKTKRELVAELVKAHPRKGEAALLKLAIKEIGGSEAQLKNYIKLAKK